MVGLCHKGQGDDGPGQDGEEDVHASKGFGVGERAGGEQAPVLGGEDLQPTGGRLGRSLHYLSFAGTCSRVIHLYDELVASKSTPLNKRRLKGEPAEQVTNRRGDTPCQTAAHSNPESRRKHWRASRTGPRNPQRRQSDESAHDHRRRPSSTRREDTREDRQKRSSREAERRVDSRLDRTSQDGRQAKLVAGVRAERVRSGQRFGNSVCKVLR